jgi:hypothetical protein
MGGNNHQIAEKENPMIIAKNNQSEFPKIPLPESGTTQAVCCGVWDLGLQKTVFNGDEKIQHKIIIAWEISELINVPDSEYNGLPYMLTKKYTLSLNEKANLRKDLESWRGKPFNDEELAAGIDIEKLYGVNCLLGVSHEKGKADPSKTFATVTSILPLVKGTPHIKPVREQTEPAPKWVQDKQAEAIKPASEDVVPEMPSDFPEPHF